MVIILYLRIPKTSGEQVQMYSTVNQIKLNKLNVYSTNFLFSCLSLNIKIIYIRTILINENIESLL